MILQSPAPFQICNQLQQGTLMQFSQIAIENLKRTEQIIAEICRKEMKLMRWYERKQPFIFDHLHFVNQSRTDWQKKIQLGEWQIEISQQNVESDRITNFNRIKNFLDELLCSICYQIAWQPQICDCCEKPFCSSCIYEWLWLKQTCPCCRKQYSARDPSKFHLNLLNKIFLSCSNEENGCDKRLNYYEFYEHEQNCTYYKLTCLNEGCEEQLLKKEELEHRLICQFEKLECFFCEQPQQRKQIPNHYQKCHQTQCNSISTLFCELCGIEFDFNQIRYHFHKGGKEQIQLKVEAKMRDYQKGRSQKPIYTQPSYNKKRKLNYR